MGLDRVAVLPYGRGSLAMLIWVLSLVPLVFCWAVFADPHNQRGFEIFFGMVALGLGMLIAAMILGRRYGFDHRHAKAGGKYARFTLIIWLLLFPIMFIFSFALSVASMYN